MAVLAVFARVGSDWEWVVAVGDHIRATSAIPDAVPFAAAPSQGWHNVPVLAEVVASLLAIGGAPVMVAWHLLMVLGALALLAFAARERGGSDRQTAASLFVLVLGGLPWWVILRLQTFSLPLFALLLLLLVRQSRHPDRRIWWAVPLVAVWGNLHGAVLLGVCVLGAYLAFGRLRARPLETVAVGLGSVGALLVNPQGIETVAYYRSVFDNVAAERGEGLWAPLRFDGPFDIVMILAIAVAGAVLLRRRRAVWEYVAVVGLCLATLTASRHGLWLLVVLFVLGAGGRRESGHESDAAPLLSRGLVAGWVVSALVVTAVVAIRDDDVAAVRPGVVAAVSEVADGGVVLAPSPLVESLAASGARVWMSNPIDAFSRDDQETYLDFLAGDPGMGRALDGSDVVVTGEAGAAHDYLGNVGDFSQVGCGDGWVCWTRH